MSQGHLTHSLTGYEANPVSTCDSKRTLYRDVGKRSLTIGGLGSVGEKAASTLADFVRLDMFATGGEDAKRAIKIAENH